MNLGDKVGLDALLRDWNPGDPEPSAPGAALSDERADAITKAALAAMPLTKSELDPLLEAPPLAAEPGEENAKVSSPPSAPTSIPAQAGPPSTERKRGSLKEIAARASQRAPTSGDRASAPGSGPASLRPVSSHPGSMGSMGDPQTPPGGRGSRPSRPSIPPPSVRGVASRAPMSVRPSKPESVRASATEAGSEDSGVINLKAVNDSATPEQIEAAKRAKPAQADLFVDEKTTESAANPAEMIARAKPAKVPEIAVVAAKPNNSAALAGLAIAALGIAAAYAIVVRTHASDTSSLPVATAQAKRGPETTPVAVGDRTARSISPTSSPTTPATPTSLALSDLPSVGSPTGSPIPVRSPSGSPEVARPVQAGTPGGGAPPSAAPGATAVATATPSTDRKPADLQAEMAKAVGAPEGPAAPPTPSAEPAAAGPGSQSVPEQPSQGSVQAAVGTVMGNAKSCVSGADDVTRANVTFASGGTVTSVSVTGWAAAHGQTACVQTALKGAKVGPFSKPSYVVSVSIRP